MAYRIGAQRVQPVFLHPEPFRHPTPATQSAPERHADQVPLHIIFPLMVDTLQLIDVAPGATANQGAPVGATVGHHVNAALPVPGDNHRRVADKGCLEITGVRNLRRQTDERPVITPEDPFLLHLVDSGVREYTIRHMTGLFIYRPVQRAVCRIDHCIHRFLRGYIGVTSKLLI